MDRFYSYNRSIIGNLDIFACGTINANRCKLSPEMKKEIDALKNEKFLILHSSDLTTQDFDCLK